MSESFFKWPVDAVFGIRTQEGHKKISADYGVKVFSDDNLVETYLKTVDCKTGELKNLFP